MKIHGLISYPAYIDEISVYLGKLRDLYNADLNEKQVRFKRGDRSEFVNILGIRGELIFQHFLHQQGVPFSSCAMLDNRPVSSYDLRIDNGKTYCLDIKTIRTDAPDLLVNAEAHQKAAAKSITHYVFIQITEPQQARYWIYTVDQVGSWDKKKVGYSEAHYLPLKEAYSMNTATEPEGV